MDMYVDLNSAVFEALAHYAKMHGYEDIELLALRDAMRIAENVECPDCKGKDMHVECGIVKCKKCGLEMYASTSNTHQYCAICTGWKLNDCWVAKEMKDDRRLDG
jgi:ribosomal protein L37AE/L43A